MSIFALGWFKKNKMSQPNISIEDICIDYAQSVSFGLRYHSDFWAKICPKRLEFFEPAGLWYSFPNVRIRIETEISLVAVELFIWLQRKATISIKRQGCSSRRQLELILKLRRSRSLKLNLVPRTQVLGQFGPPKKRVNLDICNRRHKWVYCVLTVSHLVFQNKFCFVIL